MMTLPMLSPLDEESSIGLTAPYSFHSPHGSQVSLLKPIPSYQIPLASEDFPSKTQHLSTIEVEPYEKQEQVVVDTSVLLVKHGSRWVRHLRFTLFATYERLFSVVFLTNIIVLLVMVRYNGSDHSPFTYPSLATATAANLYVSLLVRHENFVNLLFVAAGALPKSTPLTLRRWAAKVYAYGGFHSGCALAAVAWYLAFTYLVIHHMIVLPLVNPALAALTFVTILLLISITILALPPIRRKYHDIFEISHRFGGWAVVLLFWAQTILVVVIEDGMSVAGVGIALCKAPAFWLQIGITGLVIYPWLLLRRQSVRPERLSKHAVRLHFDQGHSSYCQGLRLTDRPLMETHAFAPIPNGSGQAGFSVIISNAGDWTKKIIEQAPTQIWTRGGPQYGALYVAQLFRKVVVIATGSGIAPCISLFRGRPDLQCRVLWSTPNPLETCGQGIIDEVVKADRAATIIDTRKQGRPDLIRLAHRMYKEATAEAVVIISNATVTRKVVYGLESRGVPIFAPIFDS